MRPDVEGDAATAPRFEGWRVVSAATGLNFLVSALMTQAFGAYASALRDSEGWSRTTLSGIAAMQQVEGALLGPVQGWIVDRFGPRVVVTVGLLLFGGGLMLLSTADTLPGFYAIYLLVALGTSLAGFFSLTIVVVNWFERHRSRALSIVVLGGAVAGFAVPGVAWAIQAYGWRSTAFASGVLALLAGLPMATLLYQRPEDRGQRVDGAGRPASTGTDLPVSLDIRPAQALRSPVFWSLSAGQATAAMAVGAVQVHGIMHVQQALDTGLARATALMSALAAAQTVGILVTAVVADRWDKRRSSAACMLLHAAGLAVLAFAGDTLSVLVAAAAIGLSAGIRGPLMNALRADHFGRRDIGTIVGLSMTLVLVGQIVGPVAMGHLADRTGDYRLGWLLVAAFALAGAAIFWWMPPRDASPAADHRGPDRSS